MGPATLGNASMDVAAANPLDRHKRSPDDFSEHQALIESWADAEGTPAFADELHQMRLEDVRQLMALCTNVANEHERREHRARQVRQSIQAVLSDAAEMVAAKAEYIEQGGRSRG